MLVALAVLSAAALAYEIILVHLFSVTHWAHFATLVISLALLGFGASGSLVTLFRSRIEGREKNAFITLVVLAAITFDPAYRAAGVIPFDAFELLAVRRQFLNLALTYVVLSLPFLFTGAAVAVAFLAQPGRIGRVYAANLGGSGFGALLGLTMLVALPAERLPTTVGLLAFAAVIPLTRWVWIALPAVLGVALFAPPATIPVSAYKESSIAMRLPEARLVATRDGPLGRLELITSPSLRYLPGTSLALMEPVPSRPVLYLNGEPLGARSMAADTALLTATTAAAPFAINRVSNPSILVIGLGGGGATRLARAQAPRALTIVDPDPRIDPLLAPGTITPSDTRSTRTARAFIHSSRETYDLITISEIGSLHTGAAGMAAAGVSYLFTYEGVRDMWRALSDDGVVAITRWTLDPPRDVLRLLATIRVVIEDSGQAPASRVALIRGWGTATILASRSPFTPDEVAVLRAWAAERWFDLAWAPGVTAAEANRFNVLDPDRFRLGAEGLLGADDQRFIETYPFRIAPVSDDSPFFFHFLDAGQLLRLWRGEGRLSLPYFEWGIVAHVVALTQAIPIAALLIFIPLLVLPRAERKSESTPAPTVGHFGLAIYFATLGLAFMLLEISAIQRLVLLLGEPIYATTVVLATFLVFAGFGSVCARPIAERVPSWIPFVAIAVLAMVAYAAELGLWEVAAATPIALRAFLALAVLAPLAFAMGLPFPLGLQRVADHRPAWMPWCWGVNGFLSVIAAAAAPLFALRVGFRGVLVFAIVLYLIAGAILRRL